MTLPTPALDDRRFQDIVDEAKKKIPLYCPEWTDHNVSDPGVALIELFAWMTDLTLYRLNQVPDVMYSRFLELMGISLYSAAPARTNLTFWLSGALTEPVRVPAGTQVGTLRSEHTESVVFQTDEELVINVPELSTCVTGTSDGRFADAWDDLRLDGYEVSCFADANPGDAIHFGFVNSLAGSIIEFTITARVEGQGVDPENPPWSWEVWGGQNWLEAEVLLDTTHGLNANGTIRLAIPFSHAPLMIGPSRAHYVRCRFIPPAPDQPYYHASPQLGSAEVVALGGMAQAHHGIPKGRELLGRSSGAPGQLFIVSKNPLLPRRPDETVVTIEADTEHLWTEVPDFGDSAPTDRHFMWEGATGEVTFGPEVRDGDGNSRRYGMTPPLDAMIYVTKYRHGGGSGGNVGARTLTVPKTTIPFVARVENRHQATGGVDAETVQAAKARGPMWLRSGQRAVTAADYERIALEASPNVARARCVPPKAEGDAVQVLIVPKLDIPPSDLELNDLAIPEDLQRQVGSYLDDRRILTSTVRLRTPSYQGVTVVASLVGAEGASREQVRDRALSLLNVYINPLTGGPDRTGWPFNRNLNMGEIFALLAGAEGVVGVEEVRLFVADLAVEGGGQRTDGGQSVRLRPDALFCSFQHQVNVR